MDYALEMVKKAKEKGVNLLLPTDHIVATEFSNDAPFKEVEDAGEGITGDYMGLDIGSQTIAKYAAAVKDAKQLYGMVQWVYLKWKTLQKELKQSLKH